MDTMQLQEFQLERTATRNEEPFEDRENSPKVKKHQNITVTPKKKTTLHHESHVQILHEIAHQTSSYQPYQQNCLSDFLCLKEVSSSPKHHQKLYSFDNKQSLKLNSNLKRSLVMYCQSFQKNENEVSRTKLQKQSDFNQILACLQSLAAEQQVNPLQISSILAPASTNMQQLPYNDSKFIEVNINQIPLPFSSFQSFLPVSSFNWNTNAQSEMFCLNKFYKFLLAVVKPLYQLIHSLVIKFKSNVDEVNDFLTNVISQQNIYHENKSGAFYFILVPNRSSKVNIYNDLKQLSPSKSFSKCQKIDNNKKIRTFSQTLQNTFKQFSKIFWKIFASSSDSVQKESDLHTSFLENFLQASIKGELTLQQAIQILESKQKRKVFINEKIAISAQKVQNDRRSMSINYGRNTNQESSYEVGLHKSRFAQEQGSYEFSQLNLFNDKLGKKRTSVHRKLTSKRNSDVIIQQTQKNMPPSFESRSQEKKTRLFKHDLGYKNKQRKSFSSHSRQRYYQTINGSVNYGGSSYEKMNNVYENISFMGNNARKGDAKQVSKTIEVGEIKYRNSHSQMEVHERQDGKSRSKLVNFLKSNVNSNEYGRKSSTYNISSLVKHQNSQEVMNPYSKTVTTTEQLAFNMQKRQSIAGSSKNRRYYHINNFVSSKNNNSSIENLIQTQKKLLKREPHHSASKERDLLNKSQEKALAIFNKQIKSKQLLKENSQVLQNPPKITKNISEAQKSDKIQEYLNKKNSQNPTKMNLNDQNSQLKRLQVKQSSVNKKLSSDLLEFSPPKKQKNISCYEGDMSPVHKESMDLRDSKIDDRDFRQKFSLQVNRGSMVYENHKSLVDESPKNRQEKVVKYVAHNTESIHEEIQTPIKIINEYMQSEDVHDLEKNQQPMPHYKKSGQSTHKSMDRTQKGLINAGKKLTQKLNNKNFNIEEVFAEQQMLARQNQQIRHLSAPMPIPKPQEPKRKYSQAEKNTNRQEKPLQEEKQKQRKFSTQIQNKKQADESSVSIHREETESRAQSNDFKGKTSIEKQKLEEMTGQISPIQIHRPQSKASSHQQQKNHKQNPNTSILPQKKSSDLSSFNHSPDEKNKTSNQNNVLGQVPTDKVSKVERPVSQVEKQESHKKTSVIQSLQHNKIQQAVFLERKTQPVPTKNIETKTDENLKPKTQSIEAEQSISNVKKVKDVPSTTKIPDQEESDLQEIKFTPKQAKTAQKPQTKQTESKPPVISKPPLPNQPPKLQPDKSRPASSQPKKHEPPLSPANSNRKSSKQPKRQATTESVASSFGPHKSVKKIVEQYVFMVNKIGEAVAKTPKIAKKVQTVTDWYVGAYFLYKRFLYERKKMEKYLKEGTPKLTRYDEEINLDEWKTYLKSPERQTLMTKISDENINIAKSIQKMQGKLLGKNIPESIKQHAAISQRTSRESVIAVDAIIDEFDALVEKGMLKDEDIQCHCTEMLNACLIIAELDQLVEDIVPISEFSKSKRSPEELEMIAQDLYDLYHDE